MGTVTPIQQTFLGGELSPRLRGPVSSDLYRAALALSQEFHMIPNSITVELYKISWMPMCWRVRC